MVYEIVISLIMQHVLKASHFSNNIQLNDFKLQID